MRALSWSRKRSRRGRRQIYPIRRGPRTSGRWPPATIVASLLAGAAAVTLVVIGSLLGTGGAAGTRQGGDSSSVRYRGPGFSLAVPRGWVTATAHGANGKTSTVWAPAGGPAAKLTLSYGTEAAMGGTAASLANAYRPAIATLGPDQRASVIRSARVRLAGARAAVLLTLSGDGSAGVDRGRVLVVETDGGLVIELDAARFDRRSTFDPEAAVRSLTLVGKTV